MEDNRSNINLWKRIAQVAGIFAFIISMLLIVNYIQYKRIDPVETKLINSLVERLNNDPSDSQLRKEIRTLDLLARKAYFTNQWQVRTGGYLLLISIAIVVIAMQFIKSNSEKLVTVTEKEGSFLEQKNARKWVTTGGIIIVGIALFFAYLTHNELAVTFAKASKPENNIIDTDHEIITTPAVEKAEQVIKEVEQEKIEAIPNNETIQPEIIVEIEEKKPVTKEKEVEIVSEEPDKKPEKKSNLFPTNEEIIANHNTFRGPGGNGISYHKNIPVSWNVVSGDNILWKLKSPIHGYNSPIIWGDKIFLSGANATKREIYCINKDNGNILWTTDIKDVPGSPAKSPNVTDDTGLAAPSLATDGNRVYAIFGNGDLTALDMEGKKVWERNLGSTGNHYGHSSSLMLYQDILILQYDIKSSPKLLGLSVTTGETLWETPRNVKISWASPVVVNTGDKSEILIAADPIVASYDPKTGVENWEIDCIFGEVGPSVAYADGIVYAVNEYAKLAAIKVGNPPEVIWENDEYLSDVPSPVATDELVILPTSYGVVVCYNSKTGEKYWEHEFDEGFYSSPMMVDGKIYLMDMAGTMHIFKAEKEFVFVGESSIGEKCMTTPAFTDGRLYIRGNEHLFCIGK